MRHKIICSIFFLLTSTCLHAQLKVVEECTLQEMDMTARKMNNNQPYIHEDGDTIPYAIVKVGLTEPNATFPGKWVLKYEFDGNEYLVYCMGGMSSLTIKTKRFTPLHYKFPEPLQEYNTYTMLIQKPEGEKYKGHLLINSNVPNAEVYVDGSKVSDGTPFIFTGEAGPHHIELKAEGFDSQSREIDVPMGQESKVTINLFSAGSLSVDGVGYGMVPVEAAIFTMGGPLNYYTRPQRNVSLRPFSVGTTRVSVDLWEKVMGNKADERIKGDDSQVINVSYDEIQDFISELNVKTGKEFRLPTEAEWEYISQNAQELGITDIGTSLEWCNDWFGRYSVSDTTNPRGPEEGVLRCVRGGSEYSDVDPVYNMPTFRWRKQPDKSSPIISFRLVQDS